MWYGRSVLVPGGAADAFSLITEPAGLRRWLAIAARVDLRAGGAYRWTIVPGRSACGSYTEVVPGERVVFTWDWEGDPGPPLATPTAAITLAPAEGGTTVLLEHDGPIGGLVTGHGDVWAHYLSRLAEAGARGDAGPDDWAAAPRGIDTVKSAEAALAICQRVLRDVAATDLESPTPCTEYNVQQLADHLAGSIMFFGGLAGAEYPAEQVSRVERADLEGQVADAAQVALEAWNARGLDGLVRVRGADTPADVALGILSIELLVHAWDLGQALGRNVVVPDMLAEYVLELARTIITPDLRNRGSFGDPTPIAKDAQILDQLIAYSGRSG
jgi:uncharacterized protein (TIGR03086 family)